jgi:hypothetical protein
MIKVTEASLSSAIAGVLKFLMLENNLNQIIEFTNKFE